MEQRSDLLLSTLQRYVRATGAELSLLVRTKQGAEIVLQSLGNLGGKENMAAKLRRAAGGRTTKRRTALARRHVSAGTGKARR
ncbi:MAG: hypothetical protein EPO19_08675 [Betaproteobacteria bacterium]|nr:MAG: hypothetical protein EPO19_08675 [Betaproteobacteria bacterium]